MPHDRLDHHPRKRVSVLDTDMSYVDIGEGEPIVFLHGNPTWSYLWRNVIPYVRYLGRCLAPDLVGMGQSGTSPGRAYRFIDHARYLDAWFEALNLTRDVIRPLSEAEIDAYRRPFRERAARLPMLIWPRELPIGGEPADIVALVEQYGNWLAKSELPKLLISADPGSLLIGRALAFCRTWTNQEEVTVPGIHFLQEDSADEIGNALAHFIRRL
jgi:pimeloyl-ACP methyl ester carboxylesterase